MEKAFFLLIYLLLFTSSLWSQLEGQWSVIIERSEQSTGDASVRFDNQGNVILVAGSSVSKYDPFGTRVWSREVNGEAYFGLDGLPFDHVAIDEYSNIYVLHNDWNLIYGDSSLRAVFVSKYSPSGNLLWRTEFSSISNYSNNRGASLKVYEDKVYISGSLGDPNGSREGFISCMSTLNGQEEWERTFDEDIPNCRVWSRIEVDTGGDIYLGGRSGNSTYCLLKCTGSGEAIWSITYDTQSTSDNILMDMVISSSNNIVMTGYGLITVAVDDSGIFLWDTMPESNLPSNVGLDRAREIFALDDGSVIVTGIHAETYYSTFDRDIDAYTIKVGASGNIDWSFRYRTDDNQNEKQYSNSIAQDIDENIVIGGLDGELLAYKFLINKYNRDSGELIWSFVDEDLQTSWAEITSLQISSNSEFYAAGTIWENGESKYMLKKYDSVLTSISEVDTASSGIIIYPNPIRNGEVNIYMPDACDFNIVVTNLEGKIVYSCWSLSGETRFNLSYMPIGLYIVSVNTATGTTSKRILID